MSLDIFREFESKPKSLGEALGEARRELAEIDAKVEEARSSALVSEGRVKQIQLESLASLSRIVSESNRQIGEIQFQSREALMGLEDELVRLQAETKSSLDRLWLILGANVDKEGEVLTLVKNRIKGLGE